MRGPQFSLKTLLWLVTCVACFCAGFVLANVLIMRQTLFYKVETNLDGTERWYTVRPYPGEESPDA